MREAPQFALLAAVALHDAAGPTTRLKWPNDLMLGEAKAGGILTETATTADGMIDWLTLGIGVNLAHAPELPGRATAALGAEPPEEFAARLLAALATRAETHASAGFAPIRAAWMAAGPPLGAALSLQQGASRQNGRYEGLSPSGSLLLAIEGRVLEFHAGEVV
jgi:BirA family biotin operon repressor/biotin-[acetyl-CoA-carboxylase] ligase